MKKWTCFSARLSSSFLDKTATIKAVIPAPWKRTNSTVIKAGYINLTSADNIRYRGRILNSWRHCHLTVQLVWTAIQFSMKGTSLTMQPTAMEMVLPQYVFGTISPYPTDRKVMEIIHMAFKIFSCRWSKYLQKTMADYWHCNHSNHIYKQQ